MRPVVLGPPRRAGQHPCRASALRGDDDRHAHTELASPRCRGSPRRPSRRHPAGLRRRAHPLRRAAARRAIDDLEALRDADRFRFANVLRGVGRGRRRRGGSPTRGYDGGGHDGRDDGQRRPGSRHASRRSACPTSSARARRSGDGCVAFTQTAGGRTGVPAPRRVRRAAVRPVAGAARVDDAVADASTPTGRPRARWPGPAASRGTGSTTPRASSAHKSGLADFRDWYRKSFGRHTPWGEQDSPALVTAVETALERALSTQLMRARAKPNDPRAEGRRDAGRARARRARTCYLLLDGVLRVERRRRAARRVRSRARCSASGPHLEGGERTSTLVAVTPCRVAVADGRRARARRRSSELSAGHRREDAVAD